MHCFVQQVNAGVSPQYATVTPAANACTNGGTVYLTTTDYITYRDYYPTTSTTTTVNTSDQYQTVRQHLSTTPTATYTTTTDTETTSFLDRYLRQQPATTSANGGPTYKASIHGLTVDLPSPDSGIGDTTITPRGENGALPQVSQVNDPTLSLAPLPYLYCSCLKRQRRHSDCLDSRYVDALDMLDTHALSKPSL